MLARALPVTLALGSHAYADTAGWEYMAKVYADEAGLPQITSPTGNNRRFGCTPYVCVPIVSVVDLDSSVDLNSREADSPLPESNTQLFPMSSPAFIGLILRRSEEVLGAYNRVRIAYGLDNKWHLHNKGTKYEERELPDGRKVSVQFPSWLNNIQKRTITIV
jgi:hypothetical protein